MLRRDAIQEALRMVHHTERSVCNPDGIDRVSAARVAIVKVGLTDDERSILLRAIHVTESEILS